MSKILKNILSLSLILSVIGISEIKAQDAEFTQFYAAPLNLNPALTGAGKCHRITTNYRNQWSGVNQGFNAGYTNYMAGYDTYLKKYNSGIGFSLMMDNSGAAAPKIDQDPNSTNSSLERDRATGIRSSRRFVHPTLHYAYRVYLPAELTMQIGLQASYVFQNLRTENLIFENQIDPLTGYNSSLLSDPSYTPEVFTKINPFMNFATGITLYNDIAYGGVSVKNITQPKASYIGNSDQILLQRKITVHGGTIIPLSTRYNHETYIAPEFLYTMQGPLKQINFGLYWEGKVGDHPIYAGMWVRHTLSNLDAFVPYFGINPNQQSLKIAFSYDITLGSGFGYINTWGTPEISVMFHFCKTPPKGGCPRFT